MKDKFYLFLFSLPILLAFLIVSQSQPKAEITVDELMKDLEGNKKLLVLDVRNQNEIKGPLGKINNAIVIPVHQLKSRLNELEKYKSEKFAVICRSGIRSAKATKLLNQNGFMAKNVVGGMVAFRQYKELHKSKVCCSDKS